MTETTAQEQQAITDHPLYHEVELALDTIRPWMMADGGNVKILDITNDGTLLLELQGACGSCRMSAMTMKAGVEDAVKRAVPSILKVEAVNMTV